MDRHSPISLPCERKPVRHPFSSTGKRDSGAFFLQIAGRYSNLLEEMPDKERQEIYMNEIPMGYKVLFDMELIEVFPAGKQPANPGYRPHAEFWRPPAGSYVVLYESPVDFSPTAPASLRGSHYRDRKNTALEDGKKLSQSWGMKIVVARTNWLLDWH